MSTGLAVLGGIRKGGLGILAWFGGAFCEGGFSGARCEGGFGGAPFEGGFGGARCEGGGWLVPKCFFSWI